MILSVNHLFLFLLTFLTTLFITPLVIYFSKKFNFVDVPNYRKVHDTPKPLLGGIAILTGCTTGLLYLKPNEDFILPVIIGGAIIITVGLLDDKYNISPKAKLLGQICATAIVVFSGIKIDFFIIPFVGERIELGFFGYIIAFLWIIGITNSINLIDGLDGLASGISAIALTSILVLSIINGHVFVISLTIILIGSILGFLPYNFYPAKIFLGDTGALFLGYCISVISILGLYKSVTIFSLVLPIVVLAVPIFDTMFAIIRRILNKQNISVADKSHLHHRLLAIGFSHRNTVLIIYLIGVIFGLSAIFFTRTTLWVSLIIMFILLLIFQALAEFVGLIGKHKPLLKMVSKLINGSQVKLKNKD